MRGLQHVPAWTLWRLDPPLAAGKKPLKVPTHADAYTNHARGNPAPLLTWQQASDAVATARAMGIGHDRPGEVGYVGVGFRPAGTGYACLDIDNCLSGGQWAPHAVEMMQRFAGAGLELSHSGQGLHVWFRYTGDSPGRRGRDPSGRFELYAEGQFIALGTELQGSPDVDHTAEMRAVLAQHWPPVPTGPRDVVAPDWADLSDEQQARVLAELRSALAVIPADDRDMWISIGQALVSLGDVGFDLWDEWSSKSMSYQGREDLENRHVSGDRTGYQSVFAKAQALGWANPRSTESRIAAAMAGFGGPVAVHATSQSLTNQQVSGDSRGISGSQAATSPAAQQLTFAAAAEGAIAATLPNIIDALSSSEAGLAIGYDKFLARPVINGDGTWRPMRDSDAAVLRCEMERRGFKAIGPELMRASLAVLAERNQFDSAQQWGESLRWDGVPRVTMALHQYFGVPDTPYTRAVSEYLFTALAGRLMDPGCQADMALILVGPQGARKTSSILALAPLPDTFVKVNLSKRDEDLSRRLRGKLVAELPELRGLTGRDIQGIRDWVTNRTESLVEKYQTFESTYARRFVAIGTANEHEVLDDPEGERRWLPMMCGTLDPDGLALVRDQLWAEGVAMWRAGGIRWQDAERLARTVHGDFKVTDEWAVEVERWLAEHPKASLVGPADLFEVETGRPRGEDPFTSSHVLRSAFRLRPIDINDGTTKRMAKILRGLGYYKKKTRMGNITVWAWHKLGT